MEAIAQSGGVIGINFYSGFLSQAYLDEFNSRFPDVLTELNTPPTLAPEDLDRVARERIYGMAHHEFATDYRAQLVRVAGETQPLT